MPLKLSWRSWALVSFMAVVVLLNVFVLPRSLPFIGHGQTLQIKQIIEDSQWVEGAPVFLTNHFKNVSVNHLGDRFANGFSFEDSLAEIYGVKSVDRSKDPIDISSVVSETDLMQYAHYETTTHCFGGSSKYCNLLIIWDSSNTSDSRIFVGSQIADSHLLKDTAADTAKAPIVKTFVLLDSDLFIKLTGDQIAY